MLARLLAEGLESQELLFDLLVQTVGVEQSAVLTEACGLVQHPACGGREFDEILFDQLDNETAHHFLVLDNRIEYPDRAVKFARIDVFPGLGTLGKMLITEFQAQIAQLSGALNHLEELRGLNAKLLLVKESSLSIQEQQCWLIISEIVGREDFAILDSLDQLSVTGPAAQFLDHITSSEKSTLEVSTATILGHFRGVEKDQYRFHRSTFSVESVDESLPFHPRQKIAFTGHIRCGSRMPSSSTTGTSGTPGNPGDGGANSSALSLECGTREEQ